MKKILFILSFGLFYFSCKPSFNLASEQTKIVSLANGDFSNDNYFESIPNAVKDSVPKEKLYQHLDSLRFYLDSVFFKKEDIISQDIQIQRVSSTRKINNYYFKIIEYSNSLKIQGNINNFYLKDYKAFLDSELINYSENNSRTLTTKYEGYILTYRTGKSKKWKYLPYSDLYNERLFGLETTQKIIDLYFDDIFISAQKKWDKESIAIFTEVYEEERNAYVEDGIDFEKFLKCRRKYQEKAEEDFNDDIPYEYYESGYFLEHSIKCRIYSKKLN
ncbi:hypothetical protein [Winogradskyella sp.]|uniref:hypothetical protein n=1 Tax=Winogradskyella sp. TaxID=1883156 RepID=UPI001B17C5BB|nr:hypothetical protein [Winogradskyella sp.]MBO6879872.1 hypothetical protein [Winogradskyella sp.]